MNRIVTIIIIAGSFVAGGLASPLLLEKIAGSTPDTSAATLAPPSGAGSADVNTEPGDGKKIKYWVAPMDPAYIRNEPGKSPMGMDLVPVYEEAGGEKEPTSTIRIDPVTVQNMGVRTIYVHRRPIIKTIRTFGAVTYDERRIHTVNTKFSGWIEKLYVTFKGQKVIKGQKLFDIYSPELVIAQEEYLLALRQYERLSKSPYPLIRENAFRLMEAARTRLTYWDMTRAQIKTLEKNGKAGKLTTIYAPASGVVMKKEAFEGHFVKAGQHQFEIADLSRVWVDVDVYEYELPWIKNGMPASMDLSYIPGEQFKGNVLFVYPYLSKKTRTARLRLEFPNPGYRLKPEMYANIQLESRLSGSHLVIPQEAVIDSGVRKIVFVAKGKGRFEPRQVKVGLEVNENEFQILDGIEENEEVVTSAQFMLDSESRLREAIQKMLDIRTASAETDDDLDMTGMGMDSDMDDLDMTGLGLDHDSKMPEEANAIKDQRSS